MLTRKSLVRTAQVLCMGAAVTLASTALATPSSAATLNVACTQAALQAAINTANGTIASDTLNLTPGCTYQLTTELPAITSAVLINGNGATINRQSGTFRILTVNGGNLTLRTANLTNGNANGSAIAPGAGGGIVVTGNGALTVNSSTIRNNQANFGGGLSVFSGSQANVGTTTFQANVASQNGGGIVSDGTVAVNASQINGNSAGGAGGGIAHIGTLTVTATRITGNNATTGAGLANGVPSVPGGTATLNAVTLTGNTATAPNPGGIYNNGGTVTLRATQVGPNVPNNCLTSPSPVPGCSG